MPAPRPRLTKWGSAYYPSTYNQHMADIAASLPTKADVLMGELMIELEFVCKPMKASKFTTPNGDLDNLAKPIMDVLTKKGWYGDDRQIVDLYARKRFANPGEDPCINVSLFEIPL